MLEMLGGFPGSEDVEWRDTPRLLCVFLLARKIYLDPRHSSGHRQGGKSRSLVGIGGAGMVEFELCLAEEFEVQLVDFGKGRCLHAKYE